MSSFLRPQRMMDYIAWLGRFSHATFPSPLWEAIISTLNNVNHSSVSFLQPCKIEHALVSALYRQWGVIFGHAKDLDPGNIERSRNEHRIRTVSFVVAWKFSSPCIMFRLNLSVWFGVFLPTQIQLYPRLADSQPGDWLLPLFSSPAAVCHPAPAGHHSGQPT